MKGHRAEHEDWLLKMEDDVEIPRMGLRAFLGRQSINDVADNTSVALVVALALLVDAVEQLDNRVSLITADSEATP
jgi:hypothetical protein